MSRKTATPARASATLGSLMILGGPCRMIKQAAKPVGRVVIVAIGVVTGQASNRSHSLLSLCPCPLHAILSDGFDDS